MKISKALAFLAGMLLCLAAAAQGWPQKPVRFVVPFAPGGATDIAARQLGEKLSQAWGQAVLVENRAGAGGALGAAEVARAAPDGYTLFFPSGTVMTANQHIYAKLNYDPEKDFVAVTNVVSGPQVLVVSAASPYKSVKDLINAAKAQPGKLTYGSAGIGAQTHLVVEKFLYQAGIEAVHVPYKGEAPGLAGLVAGDITFLISNLAGAMGHISNGRVRAIGVTSKLETPQLPGVAPIDRSVPGFESAGWFGIVAPAGTPKEVVTKVYRDTKKALETTELRARLYAQGLFPVANSPQEFASQMRSESQNWEKVVRARNIRVQ